MRIVVAPFTGLEPLTAYAVWQLRQQVFVVEQDCPYPDLDGRDTEPGTRHVVLLESAADSQDGDAGDAVVLGCARVLDDGVVWRIGRVVLAPVARGRGLADELMAAALGACAGRPVVLDAQAPLVGWYARLGFVPDGPEFLEDGIPHVPMRRPVDA